MSKNKQIKMFRHESARERKREHVRMGVLNRVHLLPYNICLPIINKYHDITRARTYV
jgi:hypothetical protein